MGDEYGKPFVLELRKKWFNTTVGKQYKSICDNDPDNITQQELSTYMRDAFLFILRYCTFHKKTRYIIEGLQIYSDVESSLVKDYPIIIKGTSMLKSFMRRSNKSIDNLAYYIQTEKELKKYYDEKIVGDISAKHILISTKTDDSATDEEKKALPFRPTPYRT